MTWIYIFNALLTPVIAGVVAYIAYQQHKTNRDRLRFDLYDRRLKVFEGLMALLWVIFRKGTCNDQERDQFQRATVEGSFLFGKDIANYLDTIHKKTLELGAIRAVLNSLPPGDQAVEKERQLFDWFTDQFEVSKEKFEKYLGFRQVAKPSERRNMKWKIGFKRVAWVLSVFTGILLVILALLGNFETFDEFFVDVIVRDNPPYLIGLLIARLFVFIMGFLSVWVIYWVVSWAVRGFCDDGCEELKKTSNS